MLCAARPMRTPARSSSSRIGFARQLAPAEALRQLVRHVGGDERQRAFVRRAHAHRLLHARAGGSASALRHRGRGGDHVARQHLDLGLQAHRDDVLQQAGELRPTPGAGAERAVGVGRARPRAAAGPAVDQALGGEPLERLAHGDARHAELLHQRQLAAAGRREAALGQLLAQHQVDLVVLGQRHGGRHAPSVYQSDCPVNRTNAVAGASAASGARSSA